MTWQISRASNVLMKNVIFYALVIREIRKKLELKCSTSKLDLLMKILHVREVSHGSHKITDL